LINKIELKNFRCFKNISIDGIKPVTLIAGANNVGKSTVLESIFLFMGRYTNNVFFHLNNLRGITNVGSSPQLAWESFFYNQNVHNEIIIKLKINGQEQTVEIGKYEKYSKSSIMESLKSQWVPAMNAPLVSVYPLTIRFFDCKQKNFTNFILDNNGGFRIELPEEFTINTPFTYYLHTMSLMNPQQLVELYGKLDIENNKNSCIKILKLLDDRINDLSVIPFGGVTYIYADLGKNIKYPINILGDGINKLMQIILLILANPGALILADEIENGFHYSFYPKLWDIIGNLVKETKSQLIATSHSYECINAAESLAKDSEMFCFLRLDKLNDTIYPQVFDNESFIYSINNDWEVR